MTERMKAEARELAESIEKLLEFPIGLMTRNQIERRIQDATARTVVQLEKKLKELQDDYDTLYLRHGDTCEAYNLLYALAAKSVFDKRLLTYTDLARYQQPLRKKRKAGQGKGGES